MFRHILIPTDGSPHAVRALEKGLALAKALGARVTMLTVIEPFHVFSMAPKQVAEERKGYKERAEAEALRILAAGDKSAQEHGVAYATLHRWHEQPYEAIAEAANKGHFDLIVMGSHGRRGVAALVLGSVTNKVLIHSSLPVLVCR